MIALGERDTEMPVAGPAAAGGAGCALAGGTARRGSLAAGGKAAGAGRGGAATATVCWVAGRGQVPRISLASRVYSGVTRYGCAPAVRSAASRSIRGPRAASTMLEPRTPAARRTSTYSASTS